MATSEIENSKIYKAILETWHQHYFQFILEHLDLPWNWHKLASNPNITWDIVESHPDIFLDSDELKEALCLNPSVTKRLATKNKKYLYDWHALSSQPWITWAIVKEYGKMDISDEELDWTALSANPQVATWTIVKNNPDKPWEYKAFEYKGLCANPNITWDIVQKNPDKPWDYTALSANPSITWDIVQKNPKKPWDWAKLCSRPDLTWEIVLDNPTFPWNWKSISANPSVATWDIVQKHPEKPWDMSGLSINPHVTWEVVSKHFDMHWDWEGLSVNPNMTWEVISKHMDENWMWHKMGLNPNMTWEIALKIAKKYLDDEEEVNMFWREISENKMDTYREAFIHDQLIKTKKTDGEYIIQVPTNRLPKTTKTQKTKK